MDQSTGSGAQTSSPAPSSHDTGTQQPQQSREQNILLTKSPAPKQETEGDDRAQDDSSSGEPKNAPERGSKEGQTKPSPDGKGGKTSGDVKQSQTSPELYEVSIDGKVKTMTLQQLKNAASISHAAYSRFEEASRMKKEADTLREGLAKDMIKTLQDPKLGLTRDQIRAEFEAWYEREFINPEQLTPEQRKIKEYEERLKKYQDEEQAKLKAQKEQEETELTNKQREYLQTQIIQALEKSGLPKTKYIASRMAFYMRENLLKGWEAPIDVIVQQVEDERQALRKGELEGLDGEDLIRYLGDDIVGKIRRYDLAKLRERKQNLISGDRPTDNNADSNDSNERLSSSDVKKRLLKLTGGKLLNRY